MTRKTPELSVVPLGQPASADNIAAALRTIADGVEAGEYDLVTTAVVVLGHVDVRRNGSGEEQQRERYYCHGLGPRHDTFTVRGLLLAAAADPSGGCVEDEPGEE